MDEKRSPPDMSDTAINPAQMDEQLAWLEAAISLSVRPESLAKAAASGPQVEPGYSVIPDSRHDPAQRPSR